MRLAVISELPCEGMVPRVILGGLKSGYEKHGVPAIAAGIHCYKRSHPPDAFSPLLCVGGYGADRGPYYDDLKKRLFNLLRHSQGVHYHHFQDCMTLPMAAVWYTCRQLRIPFFVTFQEYDNPHDPKAIEAIPKKFRVENNGWFQRCLMEARGVSAPSRYLAKQIAARMPAKFGRNIQVIPNGHDPNESARPPIQDFSGDPQDPIVVCVGRLWLYKGIDVLVEAWKNVCRADKTARLVVYGAGVCNKKRFQALARQCGVSRRIDFAGQIPRTLLFRRLHECLFSVLPSRHEAFGMAVVEAMACGKAVVATRSGGPQEIIRDGITGLLVPPGDPQALASAMLKLLKNRRLREDLGSRARTASVRYHWPSVARSYLRWMEISC